MFYRLKHQIKTCKHLPFLQKSVQVTIATQMQMRVTPTKQVHLVYLCFTCLKLPVIQITEQVVQNLSCHEKSDVSCHSKLPSSGHDSAKMKHLKAWLNSCPDECELQDYQSGNTYISFIRSFNVLSTYA